MRSSQLWNRTNLVVLRLTMVACGVWGAVWWMGDAAHGQAGFGAVGGVYIDPEGMLRQTSTLSEQELRGKLAGDAQVDRPSPDVAARSPLRKISLHRLEQAVARFHESGETIPAEVRFLAGLT